MSKMHLIEAWSETSLKKFASVQYDWFGMIVHCLNMTIIMVWYWALCFSSNWCCKSLWWLSIYLNWHKVFFPLLMVALSPTISKMVTCICNNKVIFCWIAYFVSSFIVSLPFLCGALVHRILFTPFYVQDWKSLGMLVLPLSWLKDTQAVNRIGNASWWFWFSMVWSSKVICLWVLISCLKRQTIYLWLKGLRFPEKYKACYRAALS